MTRSQRNTAHVDPELAAVNLVDLEELYYGGTGAPRAVAEFNRIRNGTSRRKLSSLLRSHICRPIVSNAEIELRDAFDDLLAYYAILEIASSLGYVGELPEDARRQAVRVLGDDDVQEYYQSHYPLLLPRLMFERASGQRTFVLDADAVDLPAFMRFLDLNATIEHSDEADVFLAMLDDYRFGDGEELHGMDDLLIILGRPREFARRLSRPEKQRHVLDTALQGFRVFLRFCRGMDDLLRGLQPSPLQQSLLWHHHAYWFEIVRDDVGAQLHAALRQFERWQGASTNGTDNDHAAEATADDPRSLGSMHVALRRLMSGRYGWVLRETSNSAGLPVA